MGDYGARIKAAREAANLTQEQLGEKIGVTGVTIMRYEKNQREPRLKQLIAIANALEISPGYLMGCMSDDGAIDLGLVAIELSRTIGIDRSIVYDALMEVDPEDPFSEETLKAIREKSKLLRLRKSMEKCVNQAMNAHRGSFDISKYMESHASYSVTAVAEIRKSIEKLNEDGQKEAVKRVAELTEIPRYQKNIETDQQEKIPPQAEVQDGKIVSESDTE